MRIYPIRILTHRMRATVFDDSARPQETLLMQGTIIEVIRTQKGEVAFGCPKGKKGELKMFLVSEVILFARSKAV